MLERGHGDREVGEDEAEVLARDAEAAFGQVAEPADEVEGGAGGEVAGRVADFVLLGADAVPAFDHLASFGTTADPAFDVVVGFADGGACWLVRCWGCLSACSGGHI